MKIYIKNTPIKLEKTTDTCWKSCFAVALSFAVVFWPRGHDTAQGCDATGNSTTKTDVGRLPDGQAAKTGNPQNAAQGKGGRNVKSADGCPTDMQPKCQIHGLLHNGKAAVMSIRGRLQNGHAARMGNPRTAAQWKGARNVKSAGGCPTYKRP